jgi:hypothetical protein
MAAFVEIGPFWGLLTPSITVPKRYERTQERPMFVGAAPPRLVSHWLSDPGGRLACHWDVTTRAAPSDERPKRAA